MSGLRILYLCGDPGIPVLGHKGASTHVRALVGALIAQGHTVTVVCTARGEGNTLAAEIEEVAPGSDTALLGRLGDLAFARSGMAGKPGAELKRLLHNGPLYDALSDVALRLKPEVLYERYTLLCTAGSRFALTYNLPHILELNAPLIEERQRYWGLALPELARRTECQIFSGVDALLAVSEPVRDYAIASGASTERVTVLPNGVDPVLFSGRETEALALRAAYGLGTAVVIGFVGSLKPWHGVDLLLEAFARARDDRMHLLIAGDGPQGEALRARAAMPDLAGTVTFAGQVPHSAIGAYLAAMDLAVAPYRAPGPDEGAFYFSPLKVFEYMAAGCPVVAPRLGQIATLVEHERHGLLYPPDDIEALAAGLRLLAADPARRTRMGAAAAAHVGERYTWSGNAHVVADLARRLAAHRTAADAVGVRS